MGLREEVELKPDIKVGKFKGMGMVALERGGLGTYTNKNLKFQVNKNLL